ncbi:ogr/Delta-like zinc finger family protein [Enterobacter kobei]|nr:ogr/Delta-like zinc finger family protein [Enterobacter kobei]
MRAMKIFCPECHANAVIRKSVRKHEQLSDLYCACGNVDCGHTFVMTLTFSHTLSPSKMTAESMFIQMIGNLSPQEKKVAMQLLQGT